MAKKSNNKNPTNCELTQQSLDYLGINKQPFSNEILTEKSCFNLQAAEKIIDSLSHQVQFSDLLLLVEGSHGSGKTTLYRQFIQTDITNIKILFMHAEATDTLVQIQQKISLHLEDLGDANHLEDNLKSLQNFDQRPLLVIDNSHVLSDTTLQELFRYQQRLIKEYSVSLKILLFANTGMQVTLQKITDIQNTQIYVQLIPDLTSKLCESFIMHRLHNVGYSDGAQLDDSRFQEFFSTCQGSPLSIMSQATGLFEKIISNKLSPKTNHKNKAIIASSIILLIVGGAFTTHYLSLNEAPIAILTNNTVAPETTHFQDEELSNNTALYQQNNDIIEEKVTKTEYTEAVDDSEIVPSIKEAAISQNQPELLALHEETPVKSISKKIIINTPKEIVKPQPKKTSAKPNNKPPAIAKVSSQDPALQQLDELGLHNATWLKQQNSRYWTFQLLGARDSETLLKFAKRNKLGAQATWYKAQLKSRPYYVIVYGSYTSRKAAADAIKTLPTPLRALKPWIKTIKSVQKALK